MKTSFLAVHSESGCHSRSIRAYLEGEQCQWLPGSHRAHHVPASPCSHTSRFLVIWTCFLPFALWTQFQWLTPPVATVVR
jgi:Bestrophin, RFP-TM, chloride channel